VTTPVLVVERRINASPRTVFSFFTDPVRWMSWQGIEAKIDPRPGGELRMAVRDDAVAVGEFVAVEPHSRIVFTWGWEIEGTPVPPGTSTVEVVLEPDGPATVLRLSHYGLPLDAFAEHSEGWNHYVDRLVVRAEGGDPGPDKYQG
jgi:uncharacterized protein YndB with AHSA1/START domain